MKKSLSKIILISATSFLGLEINAQCPVVDCGSSNVTISNDTGTCGATMNYAMPSAIDTCIIRTDTFNFTGSQQMFTVPAGVSSIKIYAYGAQGGFNTTYAGGQGGFATGNLAVTSGQVLNIYVGGKGVDGNGSQNCNQPGGFNGGGPTGGTCCSNAGGGAGSGGGASDVRLLGNTLNDRVIVAAGGGGAGDNDIGANGGGLIGDNGGTYQSVTATGGTQTAGGLAGGTFFPNHTCSPATDGSFGIGGDGDGNDAGGGGGGWYGGGGGANNSQGAGGSSYIGGVTSGVTTSGGRIGNGMIVIEYNDTIPSTQITQIAGLPSGSVFPVGVTTNTFVATVGMNTDTCSFTVTVNDTTNPTVNCPANVTTCNPIVNNIGSTSSDNCTGETISYTLSGATTGTGTGDASGTSFGVGVTTVTYVATDASNNQDSCSFTVTVNPLPSVAIASFSPDTVCETDPAINLPVGTPASGTYSGNGVVGATFDPNTAGVGVHYVVYSFTDSNSCANMDSTMIVVESCVGIDENGTLSGINIYPNPTSNNLTIELGVLSTEVNLTLTSVEGKIVYQENNITTNKVSVDMSNNSQGIYFLRVEANNKYKVYKVVKE